MQKHNPNTQLAAKIFQQLNQNGLLTNADQAQFIKALAEGALRESHWRALLETTVKTPNNPKP